MMSTRSLVRPPRVAAWLVESLVREEQAGSILGDLLEEFSGLVSKSGVALARRWYWRQSLKTVAHLIGTGGALTLWPIAGGVIGGCLSIWLLSCLSQTVFHAILYKYHVHNAVVVFWINYGRLIEQILNPIFVGCAIALATKRRAIITAIALGAFVTMINGASLARLVWGAYSAGFSNSRLYRLTLPLIAGTLLAPVMTVIGASIALKIRSALGRQIPDPRNAV